MAEHWRLIWTLRRLRIHFDPQRCTGVWQCIEVCPVACWEREEGERRARFVHRERCIACGACVLQCPRQAIELKLPQGGRSGGRRPG